jgi:hypothetical protein
MANALARLGAPAAAALLIALIGTGCSAPGPQPQDTTETVTLDCNAFIDLAPAPTGPSVVLGTIQLTTKSQVLQANPVVDGVSGPELFAKQGLTVRPGHAVDLIVPSDWTDRLSIGWGAPSTPTRHLHVPACPANRDAPEAWLVFSGGYLTARPACVPLLITTDGRRQQVSVAVGTPC